MEIKADISTSEKLNTEIEEQSINSLIKVVSDEKGGGTIVNIGGKPVPSVSFDDDPQTQIDGKADKTTTEEALENLSKSVNGKEPAFSKNTAFNKNFGTTAGTVCQGNDARLSNARPASDVYAWAKQPTKPTYTKAEVGLGNVDNTADVNKPVSTAQAQAIADAKSAGTSAANIANTHIANKSNPHSVTKAQVGLSSVANERQYSAQNPPPYPVKSVDGMTGAVSLAGKYIQYQGDNAEPYSGKVGWISATSGATLWNAGSGIYLLNVTSINGEACKAGTIIIGHTKGKEERFVFGASKGSDKPFIFTLFEAVLYIIDGRDGTTFYSGAYTFKKIG